MPVIAAVGPQKSATGGHLLPPPPNHGASVPQYFFHRIGGLPDVDNQGVDLPDVEAAKQEALAFASDTLKDRRFSLSDGGEIRVEATDANDVLLFTVFLKSEVAMASNAAKSTAGPNSDQPTTN